MRAASVNMADVDYLLGRPKVARLGTGFREPRNKGLGLDVAGVVEATGRDVTRFQPDDEVIGDLSEHGFGAFAEFVCAPEEAFAKKPTGLSFEQAAAVPQAGVMALQGLGGRRKIKPGHRVLINGAGGNVGPFAVQIAKSFGAEVTGVDSTEKLDMMRSIGADHVIDYTKEDYADGEQQYDWILDVAAHRSIWASRGALAARGVYVMIPDSVPRLLEGLFLGPLVSLFSRRKMGMLMGKPFAQKDVASLKRLLEEGKVIPVIDKTFPLSQVPEALSYQMGGRTLGKIIVTM